MVRLEPSTALTPTSNWRLGFQWVDNRGSSMKPVACFNIARPDEKAGSSGGGESPVAACVQRLVKATLASSSDSAFESSFMFVLDLWRRRFMEHCPVYFNLKRRMGGEKTRISRTIRDVTTNAA